MDITAHFSGPPPGHPSSGQSGASSGAGGATTKTVFVPPSSGRVHGTVSGCLDARGATAGAAGASEAVRQNTATQVGPKVSLQPRGDAVSHGVRLGGLCGEGLDAEPTDLASLHLSLFTTDGVRDRPVWRGDGPVGRTRGLGPIIPPGQFLNALSNVDNTLFHAVAVRPE